ncbi:SDR family oxidoreductase [Pseudolysinimonas sp.]
MTEIAVTGATGVLGRYVAQNLADRGVAIRLLARTPEKAPLLPDSTVRAFSYGDVSAARQALEGTRVLFMVSASESPDRLDQHRAFVDAAVGAGIQHIVYTSFFGASPDATFTLARDHDVTEKYIRATGLDHTFLRDNLYLDFLGALTGEDGVIRGPAGDGLLSAVARVDIARVAAEVLLDTKSHVGATYDLTGREARTLTDFAKILSRHQGRTVTFHDESVEEAYESRRVWAADDWQNDAWVSTYTAIRAGEMATVSSSVEDITGVPPLTLDEFLTAQQR